MSATCPAHSQYNATTNACEGDCANFPGVSKLDNRGVCRQPTRAECNSNNEWQWSLCLLYYSCGAGVLNPATGRCNALCKDVPAFWKPVNETEVCEPWTSAECFTYLNTFVHGPPVQAGWVRDACVFTECPKNVFFELDLPEPIGVVRCRNECSSGNATEVLHGVDITGLCEHVPTLDRQLCSAVTEANVRWGLSCTSVVPPTLDSQVIGVTSTPELGIIVASGVGLLCLLLCVSVACFLRCRRYRDDSDSELSDEEYGRGRKRSRRRGRRGRDRESGSFCGGAPCMLGLCCTLLVVGAVAVAALAWRKALGTPAFAGVCGGVVALGCAASAAWHWQRTRRARLRRQERAARKAEEKEERRRRRRRAQSKYHDDDVHDGYGDGYGSTDSEYDAAPHRRARAYAASSQSCSSEDRCSDDDEPRRGRREAASAGRARHSGRSRSAETKTWQQTRRARTGSSSRGRVAATALPPRGVSRRTEEDRRKEVVRTAPARTRHGTPEHAVFAQPTASPLHPGFYDDSESRAKAARKAAKRAAAAARSEAQRAAERGRPPAHSVQAMGGLG